MLWDPGSLTTLAHWPPEGAPGPQVESGWRRRSGRWRLLRSWTGGPRPRLATSCSLAWSPGRRGEEGLSGDPSGNTGFQTRAGTPQAVRAWDLGRRALGSWAEDQTQPWHGRGTGPHPTPQDQPGSKPPAGLAPLPTGGCAEPSKPGCGGGRWPLPALPSLPVLPATSAPRGPSPPTPSPAPGSAPFLPTAPHGSLSLRQ